MAAPRILVFAGSTREGSWNRALARQAAEAVRAAGGDPTLLELRDHPLPLFDQDLEARDGLPEGARSLKEAFAAHDGLVIACPEYNSSITPVLKNAIDWVSRPASRDEPPLSCYRGKTALLLATSPGALGGLRGLAAVRSILGSIGVLVLPDQLAVPKAHEAFDGDGALVDDRTRERIATLAAELVRVTAGVRPT